MVQLLNINGLHNVVADALSRLDADFSINLNDHPSTYEQAHLYAAATDIKEYEFPLSGKTLTKYQKKDSN